MLLRYGFFNRLVGRGMTLKRMRKTLKKLFLGLSLSTKNSIDFFKNLPLVELDEWIDTVDEFYKEAKRS